MATREGTATMAEDQNRQALFSKTFGWVGTVRQFWRDVMLEMKKVSWPTRAEVVHTTVITIVVVFFFAAYLWAADLGLSYLVRGIEWLAKHILS